MKITLVISSLYAGGAERVLVLLAQGFLNKGYEVSVVTLSGREQDSYTLPSQVHRLALNVVGSSPTPVHALSHNLYRLWMLRQAVQSTKPDVVISFLDRTNVLTLIALTKTGYPVIATEHCVPSMIPMGAWWNWLRFFTYPHTAKIVSVSRGVDQDFEWLPRAKRAVIYNPLLPIEDTPEVIQLPEGADPAKKWVIAMGRLSYVKGFDILLSAFSKIAKIYSDWQLLILGEGEHRIELETLRDRLGLRQQVILAGHIRNPFPLLKFSNLFVLSSRSEGFGNVLIEAMACGLPVISTDCPYGPREIICDGVDGILVPTEDVSALAVSMARLMADEEERKRLATYALQATERFALEKIIDVWDGLLLQIVKEKQ